MAAILEREIRCGEVAASPAADDQEVRAMGRAEQDLCRTSTDGGDSRRREVAELG